MTEATLVGALLGMGMAMLFVRLATMDRRLNRLSRLDAKVDALLLASGAKFDELEDVPSDEDDLHSGTAPEDRPVGSPSCQSGADRGHRSLSPRGSASAV